MTEEKLKQELLELQYKKFEDKWKPEIEKYQSYVNKCFSSKSLRYYTPLNGKQHTRNVSITVFKIVEVYLANNRYGYMQLDFNKHHTLEQFPNACICFTCIGINIEMLRSMDVAKLSYTNISVTASELGMYYEIDYNTYSNIIKLVLANMNDITSASLKFLKNVRNLFGEEHVFAEKNQYEILKNKGYEFVDISDEDYNNVFEFLPFLFNNKLLVTQVVKEVLQDKIKEQKDIISRTCSYTDYYGTITVEEQTRTQHRIIDSCNNILQLINTSKHETIL